MDNNTNYKVCDICNSLVSSNEIFNIKDKEICKSCVEKKLEVNNRINKLGIFICSLVPGVGQIALRKNKKGIFLLSSFFVSFISIIISIVFFETNNVNDFFEFIFNIVILLGTPYCCIVYLYSLFDANITRRFIENNVYIDGAVDKLVNKINFNIFRREKNKKYLKEKIIDKRLQ